MATARSYWREGAHLHVEGLDWSDKFTTLCAAGRTLPAGDVVLDGEIVAPNDRGVPDLHALRAAIGRAPDRLLFYAFDALL